MTRPYVLMNMAMSADGKISTHEEKSVQFSSVEDRRVMDTVRVKADAILIGANSLRIDGIHLWIKDKSLVEQRLHQGQCPHPINIVISKSLDLPHDCRFFKFAHTEKWIITSEHTTAVDRQRFADVATVFPLPEIDGRIDPGAVMAFLHAQGIKTLLLEGGSQLNFQMIARHFVDEFYVTICPLIIGGDGVTTPVGGTGFSQEQFRNLELQSFRQHEGEIFLHYRFRHDQIGLKHRYQDALGREEVYGRQP